MILSIIKGIGCFYLTTTVLTFLWFGAELIADCLWGYINNGN